ncbi:type IV toxin-antitoxin system AbiEi family antitoxin domain-containing protein [Pseudonocardia alni]|uniref:type IV toxin-antitoxin system AbiEi family antitoxin domain-containing protein n=1 Tax=Pseudonocardia alni TaxID=33907 RepID=UPI0027A48022|nr:type IV toxin-antitoxin system AbiEi family antitoxin domain-containing protein [Pseudonocardia alni]
MPPPSPVRSPVPLRDLLLAQDGVLSAAQARATGLSRQSVRRRVARGEWVDLHPGVLAEATRVPTAAMRVRAAALWAGPSGLVHGPAAACWSGMIDRWPRDVGVTLPAAPGGSRPAASRCGGATCPVPTGPGSGASPSPPRT